MTKSKKCYHNRPNIQARVSPALRERFYRAAGEVAGQQRHKLAAALLMFTKASRQQRMNAILAVTREEGAE